MSGDDIASTVFYSVLLAAIGGSFLLSRRRGEGGKTLQQALIWVIIFGALVVLYGQRDTLNRELFPRQATQVDGQTIAVTRGPGGSFRTTLDINGARVDFLVDTGATDVVLTRADAARAGFIEGDLRFIGSAMTANGMVRTAPVTIDRVEFAGRVDRDVGASVNEGELSISLLGMAYLNRFDRIEIDGNRMLLIDE